MPRGKYQNHKGKNRRFTNPEELEEQKRREEKERQWRQTHGEESSEEEDGATAKKESTKSSGSSESESESESDDEVEHKAKGVENLIEVENPNRVQKKTKKSSALNEAILENVKPNLSRKEREELDKQRATQHYQKLHAEGKTEEARSDLARLAIIKQQREEAAKQRDLEKQRKEVAKKEKTAFTQKALGKK